MPKHRVQIIAEVGSVHDGSLGNAMRLIDAVAQTGADAVKFQTHLSAHETLRDAPMPDYFKGEPRYDYFERTGFTPEQWRQLKAHADAAGITFLSSPFSVAAVDLLEAIGMPTYKVPSGEVSNLPLLERIKATGKPVLLSSGMSNWAELDRAAAVFDGNTELTMMQCSSAYPCPDERVGLNIMSEMAKRYQTPVGLSDHTLKSYSSFAAVTLGATVIEKHFAFSRQMYGSDAKHSLEPAEFTDLVAGIRAISTMLGSDVDKDDLAPYADMKMIFEKSVVARIAIDRGQAISADMLDVRKPGSGIPASGLSEVVGRTAKRAIEADTLVQPEDLA